jgi:hypothetical protein
MTSGTRQTEHARQYKTIDDRLSQWCEVMGQARHTDRYRQTRQDVTTNMNINTKTKARTKTRTKARTTTTKKTR